MTPENLERLIAEGETLNVAFKSEERSPLKGHITREGEHGRGVAYRKGPK
jgi:hypothetical protein